MSYTSRKHFYNTGRRSKFEVRVEQQIKDAGLAYTYETAKYEWYKKVRAAHCWVCNSKEVYSKHWYTPDYFLSASGIVLEVKGKFTGADRTKHIAVREAHPELDLRFVFMRDNKLTPKSNTRYSEWANANSFDFCMGTISDEWLEEFKQ